jgi:hypothetical protein
MSIDQCGSVEWPSSLPAVTTCGFSMWDTIKDKLKVKTSTRVLQTTDAKPKFVQQFEISAQDV